MRIAVNLRHFAKGKIGGLENYVRHVVRGVAADQTKKGQPTTLFVPSDEAQNALELAPNARLFPLKPESAAATIAAELETGGYDLLFCPLLVLDPLPPRIASAVTIPDLLHEFFPEFLDPETLRWRRETYQPSAFHADVVFTISEHARNTLVERFGIDPAKIEVTYLDVDEEFRAPAAPRPSEAFRSLGLPQHYLYFPANFWPHKNHSNLLRAMQILHGRYPDLGLALTGSPTSGADRIEREITQLGLQEHVRVLGYQDRTVVVELYRNAQALVFVSRFEGFGIPVLEAFHAGIPVIISRAGACAEIAAGAALPVDESDPAGIAEGIERILNEPESRRELIEKGKVRAQAFSWQRAINLTLQSFDRITRARYASRRTVVQEYPLVSIVTPSYNKARFLEKTIRSVLSQDYPYIDYIVMDGGSTDGSVEVLRKYAARLRYESNPGEGQAEAINRGFHVSRGRVFAYLKPDDTYLPGAVGNAVRHMITRPEFAVVYGEAYYVGENGEIIDRYPTRPFDPELLSKCCYICQPAAFLWQEVFLNAGMMNPKQRFALDYDLWMRIAKRYPMLKIDEFLAASPRCWENETLRRDRAAYMEILSALKAHYGYIPIEWVHAYASYLLGRRGPSFEPSRSSAVKYALSLLLGSYYNSGQLNRYWKQWLTKIRSGAATPARVVKSQSEGGLF